MHSKTILDNGLKVVSFSMPQRESVSLGVWIKAGSRYENATINGIAHFLEHLVFKGSKKYSGTQIKESIEGVGGMLNGFTSEEFTCYLSRMPKAHYQAALDVLCEMVLAPRLDRKELEKERTVILEEIKMYRDQPQNYVYELLDSLLWPGHPLGRAVIGTKETIGAITAENIANFRKEFYGPLNIVVSACGNFKHDDLVRQAGKIFSRPHTAKPHKFIPFVDKNRQPRINILTKDTEQTHLLIGFRALKRDHPDRHALNLLHIILGANMSSRLFNEVREKRGLAYEIGTQVRKLGDTGAFIVHAGIDNSKISDAIEVITKEFKKMKKNLVGRDEFRRAKEFYLGQLALSLEDTLDYMLWIGETESALNKTYSLKQIIKEVDKLKLEDLRRLAGGIFIKDNFHVALIGPIQPKDRKPILGFSDILN